MAKSIIKIKSLKKMKNLKKLSREELKSVSGGKRLPSDPSCLSACYVTGGQGNDICTQYGLTCGFVSCWPGGPLSSKCV